MSTAKKILVEILDFAESSILAIAVVMWMFTFIFRIAIVDGDSMLPTLVDKDRLIVSHLFYTPKNGDIIIIDNKVGHVYDSNGNVVSTSGINEIDSLGKERDSKIIVKRVLAVAGEAISIDRETEKVIRGTEIVNGEIVDGKVLDEDYITGSSTRDDSMVHKYPLIVPKGYVFVMGDNRPLSRDSRSKDIGFVKVDDIMGKAFFRIYPFSNMNSVYK